MSLFTISYGSYAVDQRSGLGWFSGWSKIFVLCKRNSNARFWSTRCEDCFITEQNHPQYPISKEMSVGKNIKHKKKRTVYFAEHRSLAWSTSTSGSLEPTIPLTLMPTYLLLLWYSGIRIEMGRNFIINDENPIWWHLGRIVQTKNTRVWETQDRIGIERLWDSSEENRTWLSQIEDDGEKEVSSKIYDLRILRPETETMKEAPWSRIRRQTPRTKNSRRLLAMDSLRAVF